MTMYWAPFLHLYQPPWQDMEILRKINEECYVPLLLMMKRHENAKITINIQGCLLEMLDSYGFRETIDLLKELYFEGKIELVGSAKFHPILPLIPKSEVIRQIELNEQSIRKYIDKNWKGTGFFPPEMAVSPEICDLIHQQGYRWVIMDGIANMREWPTNFIERGKSGVIYFFRDTYTSNEIAFKSISTQDFINKLKYLYGDEENPQNDHYMIIAMDGETFGHHIKYYETSFLGKVFSLLEDEPNISVVHVSDILTMAENEEKFPIINDCTIRKSTWSTMGEDIASNVPYPLWAHPLNPLHKYEYRMLKNLYALMDLLEENVHKHRDKKEFIEYYNTGRYFYDRALHSCWLWWSSMRPHWSPNLIYKGIDLVIKTALNAQLALINIKIGGGDEYYSGIIDNMEKLMNEMIEQESRGQRIRTFTV